MRHLVLAVILACVLSGTAWAGEIPSGDRTPPPPRCTQTTTGEIPTSDEATLEASTELFTLVLTLISIG